MKQIEVSEETDRRFQELKQELFGAQVEDETALYIITEEILDK